MSRLAVIFLAIVAFAAAQEISENSIIETEQNPGLVERVQNYVSSNVLAPLREMDWRSIFRSFLDNVMQYMAPVQQKEPKFAGEYDAGQERAADMARRMFSTILNLVDNYSS